MVELESLDTQMQKNVDHTTKTKHLNILAAVNISLGAQTPVASAQTRNLEYYGISVIIIIWKNL